jgi:hypothetical protein
MKRGYVRSSPYFFRLIKISMLVLTLVLVFLAAFIPAPLQEPANIAKVPNPVKSAWFLLWIQELVSYSNYLIYPVLGLAVACLLLPWLPGQSHIKHAAWLQKDNMPVSIVTLLAVIVISALTVIAMFFRGENWAFVLPF